MLHRQNEEFLNLESFIKKIQQKKKYLRANLLVQRVKRWLVKKVQEEQMLIQQNKFSITFLDS